MTSPPPAAESAAGSGALARRLGGVALRHGLGWALSVALHLSVLLPVLAVQYFSMELDSPGEETDNDGPVGNNGGELAAAGPRLEQPEHPVQVSVYKPPAKPPAGEGPAPEEQPEPAAQRKTQPKKTAAPDASGGGGTGEPDAQGESKKDGTMGKPPRGKRKPCEPIEEIVQLSDNKWRVERDMVDWYATHLRELEKQAGVGIHKDPKTGKRDGAKLYLPRCSILKQAGFKNRDIIRSVNGQKVYSIAQGVKVYLKLRNTKNVTVELTRQGEPLTHKYRFK